MEKTETQIEKKQDGLPEEIISQAYFCLECGRCTGTCPMVELFPNQFHPRKILVNFILATDVDFSAADLWLCASCYKCNKRCPQAIELPGIFVRMRKLALEKGGISGLRNALGMIRAEIPFPASFFSVCLHPERLQLDKKIKDELLNYCMQSLKIEKIQENNKKIAIIGSGPAGLTLGFQLRKRGYQIVIYESRSEGGGMFGECIPESRMKLEVIQNEIDNLRKFGLDIKTNTRIGKDIPFSDLTQNGYDAVFIGIGAHQCQKLNVEGEDLEGIYSSLDFLAQAKTGSKTMRAEKVVVIGGGNTAMDAASTAIELGAGEVTILYRRTLTEMPADKNEVAETKEQGARIQFLTAPVRFIGEQGKVKQIECIKMELGPPDMSGRKRPLPVKDSHHTIDADQVIISIGENPDTQFLPDTITRTGKGRIIVDPITLETSMKGVFAGGDAVLGPATIAEAIIAGKRAVIQIDKYIMSK